MALGSDLHRDAPAKLNAFCPKEDLVVGRFSCLEEEDRAAEPSHHQILLRAEGKGISGLRVDDQ